MGYDYSKLAEEVFETTLKNNLHKGKYIIPILMDPYLKEKMGKTFLKNSPRTRKKGNKRTPQSEKD